MTTAHSHPHPPTPTRPPARRPLPATPQLNQGASWQSTPWLVLIFLVSLLQPADTSFYVAGLRLTIYRVILLFVFIPLLAKVFSRQLGRMLPPDWLLVLHSCWVCIALLVVHGPETSLKTGGIYLIEAVGAYLIGRCYIRDLRSFKSVTLLYFFIVFALCFETIPESITGKHFLRPGEGSLGRRMGLERAFGPFEHPILLGVFCATALGIVWYVLADDHRIRIKRILQALVILVCATMSMSSGAVAGMMAQLILIVWDALTRNRRHRWLILLGLFGLAYIFVALYSNRTPMIVALSYLTFNAETAYGRVIIWDCGILEVQRYPIFGLGQNPWNHPTWISDSIDNFWLATTMFYGLPAFFTLAASVLYIIITAMRRKLISPLLQRARMGWIVTMTGLIVAACTVHLWNASFALFFFLIGSGAWLIDAKDTPAPQKPKLRRPTPRRILPPVPPGPPAP